jgi:hypothetical protein
MQCAIARAVLTKEETGGVQLCPDLWQLILDQIDEDPVPESHRVAVSLSQLVGKDTRRVVGHAVTCWATQAKESEAPSPGVSVVRPAPWRNRPDRAEHDSAGTLQSHSHVVWLSPSVSEACLGQPVPSPRREQFVSVTPTRPIGLSQLFLLSLSDAAYSSAKLSPAVIESHLVESKSIVRQGDILSVPSPSICDDRRHMGEFHHGYRVVMTEPVLQGVILLDHTKFVVLPPSSSIGAVTSRVAVELPGVDIDESFLAPSLMDDFDPVDVEHVQCGVSSPSSSGSRPTGLSTVFPVAPLLSYIEDDELFPKPSSDEDDEARAFLAAAELARRGARSGDWAVLRAPPGSASTGNREKIVRFFALPQAHEHLLYVYPRLTFAVDFGTGMDRHRLSVYHRPLPPTSPVPMYPFISYLIHPRSLPQRLSH